MYARSNCVYLCILWPNLIYILQNFVDIVYTFLKSYISIWYYNFFYWSLIKKINYSIWHPWRLKIYFYSNIKIDSVSLKLIIENNIKKNKQLSSNNIHIAIILPVKWILKLAFRSSLLPLVTNLIAASFPENSWNRGMTSPQYCCVEPLVVSVTYKIVSVIHAIMIYIFLIFNSLSNLRWFWLIISVIQT